MPTATGTRVQSLRLSFDRIGPVPPAGSRRKVRTAELVIEIPQHTASDVDAMIGYITKPVREHVRMWLDIDRFTITVDMDLMGGGGIMIDGGVNGRAKITRA